MSSTRKRAGASGCPQTLTLEEGPATLTPVLRPNISKDGSTRLVWELFYGFPLGFARAVVLQGSAPSPALQVVRPSAQAWHMSLVSHALPDSCLCISTKMQCNTPFAFLDADTTQVWPKKTPHLPCQPHCDRQLSFSLSVFHQMSKQCTRGFFDHKWIM